jgi:outer membrane protein insertion porin family
MFKKIFLINLIVLFVTSFTFAEVFTDINVSGNKRISKQSIVVFGNIDLKNNYSEDEINDILKNIYETGFFKEISFTITNSVLNIDLIENPIIDNLEIRGIKSERLKTFIIEKLSLNNRSPFVQTKFVSDLNLMKNIIKSSGYYFSKIETNSVLNEKQNSINLIYDIDLGKKAKIKSIQFLGDKKIKDRKLHNVITSEVSRFWKFLSQSVYLNYERIEMDKRLITNYYKDQGFYNVNVTNSFVEFTNDGNFNLIFNINAGNKFKFNKLNLNLSEEYDQKYFAKIKSKLLDLEGKDYSLSRIEKVLREIDKLALSKQYEFINADLSEVIIGNNKLNVEISLVDTQKFYVEKINIFGNEFTIEEVIRNSFIVDEGDPYNEILFNKSMNKIRSRNIFGKVESKIVEGSGPNLKVIDITVQEKPTGEISLGAGVGTSGGTIGGGIKENNFLGKGIKLNTNLSVSENSIQGAFTYEKPNFNNTENSLFTSINSTKTDNMSVSGYKTSDLGFSLGTSFLQFENITLRPEISAAYEKLTTTSSASDALKKQDGSYFDTYLNYSIDYDLRNNRYRPTEGFRNIFYQELPIASSNYELVNSFDTSKYAKFSDVVTKISFFAKSVNTLSDKDVRISKRLYVPARKLRGFESGKVGPVQKGDFIGGNYMSTANFNATLPNFLPAFDNTDISYFIDAANVWGIDYDSSINDESKIRSSTGIAIDIFTPVGPLNFSIAAPITKSSTDRTEKFRFNLGTTF